MNAGKSKTLATWIALLGGCIGLHRFYLYGFSDFWGWAWPLPTLLGTWGVQRMMTLGQDDHLAWLLIPLLGLALAASMLAAIVYGLMPDDQWRELFKSTTPRPSSGWAAIISVVLALFVGATVLIATIAFMGQRFFEYQSEKKQGLHQKQVLGRVHRNIEKLTQ